MPLLYEIIFGLKQDDNQQNDDSEMYNKDMIGTSMGKSDPRAISFKK